MKNFPSIRKKPQHFSTGSMQSKRSSINNINWDFLLKVNPFLIHILYFVSLSFVGFGILKSLKPRTEFRPRDIDFFFMSVSAATVSSMSTVEMEVFSNAQLIVMTVLMFVGGEVFTSMMGLNLKRAKISREQKRDHQIVDSVENVEPVFSYRRPDNHIDQIELSIVTVPDPGFTRFHSGNDDVLTSYHTSKLCYNSTKFLGSVVLGYLLTIHIFGVSSVLLYISLVSSAKDVLHEKGLRTFTFSIFTVVSTFASCGFVPTNENMIVFIKNSGLLWILIPQLLLGNTLYPSCLRFSIWVLGKKVKQDEADYLLKNSREIGYLHLLPALHSLFLVGTVLGFILIGFVLFCTMEWNSAGLGRLSTYQKVVGVLFLTTNARHSGETIVDLSTIAPAILVFFVVMMYLPPYTSFLPVKKDSKSTINEEMTKRRSGTWKNLVLSQLSYLVFFIMLICITERKSLKEDPINFSVLNIVVEVISAYGNVGFTTGYSCERQLTPNPNCVNKWYGFSGKWSDEGKVILIIVMFFGRLKKFNMNGGQAWILL